MKIARHAQIIKLINQYDIETQEELAKKLEESGFAVTQATISRVFDDNFSNMLYHVLPAMRFCRTHRPRLGAAMRAC